MSETVPESWIKSELGQLIEEIGDGGTPSTSDPQNFGGGIPWVVIDDIRPKIYKTQTTISEQGLQKSSAKLWGQGTVILSTGATIGRVGVAKTRLATKQGICGIVTTDKLNSGYLYQYLLSITAKLNALSQGSTIKETRPPTIKKIRLNLPPLPEQKKIASILTSVDEVIENTQKQIDKLQDLKKATMNELLTKGISHTEFKDSELGKIPKGWKCRELGDLADRIEGGGTPSRTVPEYWEGDIPWSTVKDLMGTYLSSTEETITELGLKQSSSRLIPSGTIILATRMAVGKAVVFNTNVAINQDLKAFFHKSIVDPKFLLQLFLSKSSYLETLATGSTVKGIRLKELRAIPVKIPPLPEQKKIASILSSIDKNIEEKQHKLNKTQSLKKSLMQDLLTGKVRVQVN